MIVTARPLIMPTSLFPLITRPQPQADELALQIALHGGKSMVFPTFSIEDPLDKNALQVAIQMLDQVDMAIFVSPHAVKKTLPLWLSCWPLPPEKLMIAAVGKSTESALEVYLSATNVICPEKEFNSEALLSLPALQAVRGKTIVIFQGETGRGLLEKVLVKRGAKVKIAVCYRRVLSSLVSLPKVLEWQQAGVNCVIYTSIEGMLNLFKLADPKGHEWLKSLPSLVISQRLAEMAKKIKIQTVIQSRNAHSSAIVEALVQCTSLKEISNES